MDAAPRPAATPETAISSVRTHVKTETRPGLGARRCRLCGAEFEAKREHAAFCGADCRRAFNRAVKAAEVPPDMRATLRRIEDKLDRIIEERAR